MKTLPSGPKTRLESGPPGRIFVDLGSYAPPLLGPAFPEPDRHGRGAVSSGGRTSERSQTRRYIAKHGRSPPGPEGALSGPEGALAPKGQFSGPEGAPLDPEGALWAPKGHRVEQRKRANEGPRDSRCPLSRGLHFRSRRDLRASVRSLQGLSCLSNPWASMWLDAISRALVLL